MELLLIVVLGIFVVVQQRHFSRINRRLGELETRLANLTPSPAEAPAAKQVWPKVQVEAAPLATEPDAVSEPAAEPVAPPRSSNWSAGSGGKVADSAPPSSPTPPKEPATPMDWERMLGVNLPVWGGAAMLVIAGFFVVNWAVETGFFTPVMRVGLCGLAAAGLLAAAFVVRLFRIANGERIAAALAAAAVATAYLTAFLASSVFGLVSGGAAFGGAIIITVAAIAVALIFGQAVMGVGLIGGYLAPFIGGGLGPFLRWRWDIDLGLMTLYLIALLVGTMVVVRLKGWWRVGLAAMLPPMLWAMALPAFDQHLLVALYLAVLALAPAAIIHAPISGAPVEKPATTVVNAGFIAAFLGFLFAAFFDRFELPYLVAVVAYCAAGSALSAWKPADHRVAGVFSLLTALVYLVLWSGFEPLGYLLFALVLLGAILATSIWPMLRGTVTRLRAAEVTGVTAAGFLILMVKLDGWGGARDLPYLWAALALIAAAIFAWAAWHCYRRHRDSGADAVLASGASAGLSLALGLVLDPGLYALTAALQVLGLALVFAVFQTRTIRVLALVYVLLYAALLLVGQGMWELASDWWDGMPFVPRTPFTQAPITLLLLPAIAFLAAATIFARSGYDTMVRGLEWLGLAVAVAGLHFLIFPVLPDEPYSLAFTAGTAWYISLAVLAIAATFAGVQLQRPSLRDAGVTIGLGVAAAMAIFAVAPIYQFWPTMLIPGPPVFNMATLALGVPAVIFLGMAWLLRKADQRPLAMIFASIAGAIGFTLVLVLIRHFYHGETLNGPTWVSPEGELYSYSAGMLIYGFALLALGAWAKSQALRIGSLVVVLATVGKVFLYDASGLDGLWRAGSFLGLGIALLAVSWFFGKFVFGIGPKGLFKPAEKPV